LKFKNILTCFLFSLLLVGCKGCYSLSGISLGEDEKTVSVQYFQNNASLAKPTYSSSLTEALKDILSSQAPLTLRTRDADLQFEGTVTGYAVTPAAIQSGTDQAALNRLTITVTVKFTNTKNEKNNFESTFSRYADFNSTQSLSSVEDALIKTINDQLVQDIFNKALINW
jgi:hypothetical protein